MKIEWRSFATCDNKQMLIEMVQSSDGCDASLVLYKQINIKINF